MKSFLIYVFPVFIVMALIVNYVFQEPKFDSLEEQLIHYQKLEDNESVMRTYKELLNQDSLNVTYHFEYLRLRFLTQKNESSIEKRKHDSNIQIMEMYKKYCADTSDEVRKIGHFGRGVMYYYLELYNESFFEFQKINDLDYPFINFFYGSYYHFFDFETSVKHYNLELYHHPENKYTYRQKSSLMVEHGQLDSLKNMLMISDVDKYVKHQDQRLLYFKTKSISLYFKTILKTAFRGMNLIGFIAAACILIIWLIYLIFIRSQSRNKVGFVVLALALGMSFAFLTSWWTDFNKYVLGFTINGGIKNDFLYSIVGIGVIEEVVKIVPFLLVLVLNKQIKEPIDYIFYASVTALGFAFVENIIYFDSAGLNTIQGRALTATVTHLFNSSLVAYGIVIGKFSKKKYVALYFFVFLLLASFCHGFYDFWLINPIASTFSFITFLWLLMSMMIWASIINNCINNSSSTQRNWQYDPRKVNNFLLYALSFIFLLQYLFVGWNYGASMANFELQKDLASGLFLIIFLTVSLSKFDYIPNYWAPLKFWDWNLFLTLPMLNPSTYYESTIVASRIKITPFGKYGALSKVLPVHGTVLSRELINWEKNWFLVQLDDPFKLGWREYNYLLVKARDENEILLSKQHQILQVRLVKKEADLKRRQKRKRDYLFIDLARIQKIEKGN